MYAYTKERDQVIRAAITVAVIFGAVVGYTVWKLGG